MEVNFYEMYLEEMALIPVLEAEEEEKVLAKARCVRSHMCLNL